jgi:hypothetical protein
MNIILTIFLLILLYVVWNLYNQVLILEKEIKKGLTLEENFIKYYEAILILLINAQGEMSRVDHKGSFSSDDEVGFCFKALKTIIDNTVLNVKQLKGESKSE